MSARVPILAHLLNSYCIPMTQATSEDTFLPTTNKYLCWTHLLVFLAWHDSGLSSPAHSLHKNSSPPFAYVHPCNTYIQMSMCFPPCYAMCWHYKGHLHYTTLLIALVMWNGVIRMMRWHAGTCTCIYGTKRLRRMHCKSSIKGVIIKNNIKSRNAHSDN